MHHWYLGITSTLSVKAARSRDDVATRWGRIDSTLAPAAHAVGQLREARQPRPSNRVRCSYRIAIQSSYTAMNNCEPGPICGDRL
jgi:hypothetical protein